MDRRAAWVLGILFGGLFLCVFGFLFILFVAVESGGKEGGSGASGDRVGVVEITGEISDSRKVLKTLEAFKEDDHIKAVVVRVDSGGGAVGPSQEIYEALNKLRKKKKVVSSMGSTAASGAFYIAMAADKVYANPGTLTGSIGVIMWLPNVEGLLKWAGVQVTTLTAGKMKDAGSMFRPMTLEEHQYLDSVLADVHEQFISAVAESRGLKVEEVRPYADGRVFSGRQAKALKLVDELGGLPDAVAAAGKLGGIQGEPKMEFPRQEKKLLRELFGDDAETLFQGAARTLAPVAGPGLQFRMPLGEAR